ncbi:[SSU ribosomal protein S18P]-alanine acetyltransferase [Caminicella sporogenes DSM 14501]|uniref:[Ribosomal protein bS18]-alanine N-acetyltransferase n=1 Tax=Caminicella sporogenes DSM 14501 TaxID=1121266 RepID=A0A1M6Q575_9FIRM|nr:ribosomal protein S18-alanine N-acetyltransferase [Caminicella sporogenes]RKD23578.1 ribosomal-protein-alanine N-acetyltransferase [Caminicella sporogenes]WIF93918.1 ribosomal protein S18-alanine N-acetyltransferase [Caminicella sporogenes]SHK15352.1 [SSU ribosomal protein S18P]-alanine acetyltransferase [Caminicella sporogenes DSM 14501]
MKKVNVRKMDLKDIDSVIEIENKSFKVPWSKKSFEREVKENMLAKYFVVEYDEKVVGYGGMWFIIDEIHITNIAVHPDFRGMNLGSFLLKSMIEYAESIGIYKMTLEVRKSNIVAQNLYKKFGFKECGVRPKYYENNEDAIIMWREL